MNEAREERTEEAVIVITPKKGRKIKIISGKITNIYIKYTDITQNNYIQS